MLVLQILILLTYTRSWYCWVMLKEQSSLLLFWNHGK